MRPYPYTYTEQDDKDYDLAYEMATTLQTRIGYDSRYPLHNAVREALPEIDEGIIDDAVVDFCASEDEKGDDDSPVMSTPKRKDYFGESGFPKVKL